MTLFPGVNVHTALSCPVCGEGNATPVRPAFDDRYGEPTLFGISRCDHCGHLMTSPRLKESDLGALYSTYYPRKQVDVADLKREARRSIGGLAAFRRWRMGTDNQGQYLVRPGELMLDVGCGSGLSLLEARAKGAQVRGVEADPNVRRIANELDLQVHIGSLLDDPFIDEQFDLIILNQVIEHIPDPYQTLVRLRGRLRSGGRMVLVFPNVRSIWCRLSGARWINWHVPYHLHHFNLRTFSQMALRSGYGIRSVRTVTPNLWTVLQFRANRIEPERGTPSSMWTVHMPTHAQDDGKMPAPAPRKLASRVFRRAALAVLMPALTIVNRFIDVLGWGDSLMVELVAEEHA